jgi:hypothetical protein
VTIAALVCLVALWMWRPVVEIFQAYQRLDEWQAERDRRYTMREPLPPPPRHDDDDQGYVY